MVVWDGTSSGRELGETRWTQVSRSVFMDDSWVMIVWGFVSSPRSMSWRVWASLAIMVVRSREEALTGSLVDAANLLDRVWTVEGTGTFRARQY